MHEKDSISCLRISPYTQRLSQTQTLASHSFMDGSGLRFVHLIGLCAQISLTPKIAPITITPHLPFDYLLLGRKQKKLVSDSLETGSTEQGSGFEPFSRNLKKCSHTKCCGVCTGQYNHFKYTMA